MTRVGVRGPLCGATLPTKGADQVRNKNTSEVTLSVESDAEETKEVKGQDEQERHPDDI